MDKCVTCVGAAAAGRSFYWSRCPLDVISDSGRYFEISFYVSPGHVVKDKSLIVWIRVGLDGQLSI